MNHRVEKENVFEEDLMPAQLKKFEEGGDPVHRGGGLPSEEGGKTSSVRCPP